MEDRTRFDLNVAIAEWRNALTTSSALSRDNLEELETHLHDSMERLRDSGLTIEESFLVATRRVGAPASVAQEFAKANPEVVWLRRLAWIVGGYLAIGMVGSLASLCLRLLIALGATLSVPGPALAVASSLVSPVIFVALLFAVWRLALRERPQSRFAEWLQRWPGGAATLVGLAVVLGHLLAYSGNLLAVRTVSAQDYGTWFVYCWTVSGLVQGLLWPVFFGWLLWRLSRTQKAQAA